MGAWIDSAGRVTGASLTMCLCSQLLGTALAQTTPAEATPPPSPWQRLLDRLTLYGDFRFRGEGDWERRGADDRRRARLRLRLGANYAVREGLVVGTRITTGDPNDARDSNATLGGDFSKQRIDLDRLFVTWTPDFADQFFVTLGKFAHQLTRNPVFEELVWYSDVQPEGGILGASWFDVGPLETVDIKAGAYIFREEAQGNVGIGVAELHGSTALSPDTYVDLSAAWYGYSHPSEVAAATVDEYQVIDAILALSFDGAGAPWKVAFEGVANVGVGSGERMGWAAGISYGRLERPGDWRAYYQYQEIGNDAVFGPVAGADTLLDRNFRGHVVNVDYRVTPQSTLRLRVLGATPLEPELAGGFDENTLRVRLDYNVKL